MAAEGHKEGLCDLSDVVAFGHNELWLPQAAKVATKLVKISPNGNTALTPGPCNTTQDRSRMFSTVVQEYIKLSQWAVTDTEAARYQ